MKKRICLLLTLIISLFIFSGRVEAEGAIMWLRCDNPDSDKDWLFYKTTRSVGSSLSINWEVYDESTNESYFIDWCWFQNSDDIDGNCSSSKSFGGKGEYIQNNKLSQGICPATMRAGKDWEISGLIPALDVCDDNCRVLAGESVPLETGRISNNQYIIYSLNDVLYGVSDREKFYVVEFYDENGFYYVLKTNQEELIKYDTSLSTINDSVEKSYYYIQEMMFDRFKGDFFQIGKGFEYTYLANFKFEYTPEFNCSDYNSCKNLINKDDNKMHGAYENFDVVFGSGEYQYLLQEKFDEWYDDNKEKISKENKILSENINDTMRKVSAEFVEASENNRKYSFTTDYSADKLLDDLEKFANTVKNMNNNKDSFKLCSSGEEADYIFSAGNCIVYNSIGYVPENVYNTAFISGSGDDTRAVDLKLSFGVFYRILLSDINKMMAAKGDADTLVEFENYIALFAKGAAYLDKYSADYGLNNVKTSRIRGFYEEFANEYGLDIIIDCEGLLGQELINKIKSYLNVVKIAIPILLIGFGIIDFTKAIFSNDDAAMKKAQMTFIKRIGIAILIFFVPIIVELILNVANKVWGFISPDTCGLF